MPRSRKPVRVEIALDGEHLDHGVADGGAAGEGDAMAGVLLIQVAALHVEVHRALAAAGLNPGNPVHLGGRGEVLANSDSRQ